MTDNIQEELKDFEKSANLSKKILRQLLDRQNEKEGHVFAIKAEMGKTISFITSAPLNWVSAEIGFAKDLPAWEGKKDEAGRIIIDEDTVDKIQQREPDWTRQQEMVSYMVLQRSHKFPPILVVAWQPWVNDDKADEWVDGRAIRNSVTEELLDTKAAFIDLNCHKTSFYALDGQHRLMAIKGLFDLIKNGALETKKRDGTTKRGNDISKDELQEELEKRDGKPLSNAEFEVTLQELKWESVGIEIIPAVLKSETRSESLERLRRIFVDVNKTARRLTKGEIVILDEDDGFAIVARRLMTKHPLLKGRVQPKAGQLRDSSLDYTTLDALKEIASRYLGENAKPYNWRTTKGEVLTRPNDSELASALEQFSKYFDTLCLLPSHHELIQLQDREASDYRAAEIDSDDEDDELDNIFFRPIAQQALASAIAEMEIKLINIEQDFFSELSKFEKKGGLKLKSKSSIWFGVLCDVVDGRMRKNTKYLDLCYRLLLHLFAGGTPANEKDELLEDFREARKIDDDNCYSLEGKSVKQSKLLLPTPLM